MSVNYVDSKSNFKNCMQAEARMMEFEFASYDLDENHTQCTGIFPLVYIAAVL